MTDLSTSLDPMMRENLRTRVQSLLDSHGVVLSEAAWGELDTLLKPPEVEGEDTRRDPPESPEPRRPLNRGPVELLGEGAAKADAAAPSMGRYARLSPLGTGGMGEVHRVLDANLNRVMALKALHPRLAHETLIVDRFVEEAQVTAQLQHPGVVPVHELGRLDDGRHYFTMKAVKGRTLEKTIAALHAAATESEWCPEPEGWTFRRTLDAFHRVCETMAYAHDRNVVHRDLKPSNIMLGGYGEVLVLDWGLAKVMGREDTVLDRPEAEEATTLTDDVGSSSGDRSTRVITRRSAGGRTTEMGTIAGTPAYMPPEQALGDLSKIGPPADVFALGVVLYEVMAGRLPFVEERWQARRFYGSEIHPLFPGRPVPQDLMPIVQRCLEYQPEDRFPNAGALAEEIGAVLEGSRARERAESRLEEAEARLPALAALRAKAAELRARAAAEAPDPLAPLEAKRPWWALEDEAKRIAHEVNRKSVAFTESVGAALADAPDLARAHVLLANHYHAEHRAAEGRGDPHAAAHYQALLEAHDDGRHASYLRGDGALTLHTDPPGARVTAYRYVPRDRRLVLEAHGELGTTPLDRTPLPMGSYRLTLQAPGRETVFYPVSIGRGEHHDGLPPEGGEPFPIPLPEEGTLGPHERYVPPGWFQSGGDVEAFGVRSMLPKRRLWLDGFAIQRHHVTIQMYVDFLNLLVDAGRDEDALKCAPRAMQEAGQQAPIFLGRDASGHFFIPKDNAYGIPWRPEWPAIFVDWHSASAYARHSAKTTGLPWRLPFELEWEKAARGVDARLFPWGDVLDPTWTVMLESHSSLPTMAPAGTRPIDESPYGVLDLGGNQRDWCFDAATPAGPPVSSEGRVLGPVVPAPGWEVRQARGGGFLDPVILCRSNFRSSLLAHTREYRVSFRLARPFERDDCARSGDRDRLPI